MTGTSYATARQPSFGTVEGVRCKAPRLIVGLGQTNLAAAVADHFTSLGWQVASAGTGLEAGWLAHRTKPAALILNADTPGETGYLTCAKVRLTRPGTRIVLVGRETPEAARRARYAGAVGYLPDSTEVAAIARAVLGT